MSAGSAGNKKSRLLKVGAIFVLASQGNRCARYVRAMLVFVVWALARVIK